MTGADDHARHDGANWWDDHHEVHDKFLFGVRYHHVIGVHTTLKLWREIDLDLLLLSVGHIQYLPSKVLQ
jgi:hypothetical protein